jgi:hypothetical protein
MNRTTSSTVALVLGISATLVQGQQDQGSAAPASSSTNPYEFSMSVLIANQYYGSDIGGIFYDGPVSFTDFVVSQKDNGPSVFGRDGVNRIGLTLIQKLDDLDFDEDYGNEYDLAIGRSAYIGPEEFPIHYDVSVIYQVLHQLDRIEDDIVQNVLTLDLPKVPIAQPYVTLYRFNVMNGEGSGWFLAPGIVRNQDVPWIMTNDNPLVLSASYRFGYAMSSLLGADAGAVYHRFALSATAKVSEDLSVMLRWTPQISANGQGKNAFIEGTHHFIEGMLTYKF